MEDQLFYNIFETRLEQDLLRICREEGVLESHLLQSDDINDKWREYAPEYMAQATKEIAAYPTVSIAWAGYVGLAVAYWWNRDWVHLSKQPYSTLMGEHGFDDMDEHIVKDILGLDLDSADAKRIERVFHTCAEYALNMIRHESEPQSKRAFYIYAKVIYTMFRIGAAIELYRLGYEYQKLENPDLN